MHAWPELDRLRRQNRDAARSRLSAAAAAIHDSEGIRVTVVFDGRGGELVIERPSGQETFSHIYTPSGTLADTVIQDLVRASKHPAECLVATDDVGVRRTVEGLGGAPLSSENLFEWARRAEARVRADMERHNRSQK